MNMENIYAPLFILGYALGFLALGIYHAVVIAFCIIALPFVFAWQIVTGKS